MTKNKLALYAIVAVSAVGAIWLQGPITRYCIAHPDSPLYYAAGALFLVSHIGSSKSWRVHRLLGPEDKQLGFGAFMLAFLLIAVPLFIIYWRMMVKRDVSDE